MDIKSNCPRVAHRRFHTKKQNHLALCRNHISALASLDDAAPVKKHRFIKYYHLAREEGLTPKTIKSGWRASGIYPWNPQKGLRSSQVKTKAITNPPSPPSPNHDDIDVLATPKSHHDVYHMIQSLDHGHMTEGDTGDLEESRQADWTARRAECGI